jgi:hypothetical protein
MARGRVWVEPGRLPAKMMVAPNSPTPRANASAQPAASPPAASGSATCRNARAGEAPRVRAASSIVRSTDSKAVIAWRR